MKGCCALLALLASPADPGSAAAPKGTAGTYHPSFLTFWERFCVHGYRRVISGSKDKQWSLSPLSSSH